MQTSRTYFKVRLTWCGLAFLATANEAQELAHKPLRQTQARLKAAGAPEGRMYRIRRDKTFAVSWACRLCISKWK